WKILQQDAPDDYVIATGEQHSVREFVERAFREAGIEVEWRGNGREEVGITAAQGKERIVVAVDPRYFRPTEVETLLGDATKARLKFGWQPRTSFSEMISEMVGEDLKQAERDILMKENGFTTPAYYE
ncbi:MAG: GDP-mannose 4,6-dehydratase, partial [Candidatus Latescibacterota bacterium]